MATIPMVSNGPIPVAFAIITPPTTSPLVDGMATNGAGSERELFVAGATIRQPTVAKAMSSSRMVGLPMISLRMVVKLIVWELMIAQLTIGKSFAWAGGENFRDH